MKFELTFKTPDVIDQLWQAPIFDSDLESDDEDDDSCEERTEQQNETISNILDFLKQFLKYNEYITIKFDTETKTANVIEN